MNTISKRITILSIALMFLLSACKANFSRNQDGSFDVETTISQQELQEAITASLADPLVREVTVSLQSGYLLVSGVRARLNDPNKTDALSFRLDLGVSNGQLTASISKSRCMVIFINQIRMKIGVMFGSPETTSGGNALKFYASVRLDIRRIGAIKEREEVVGNQTRVKVVKNKVAPPFKQIEFDIMYGEGISKTGELVDLGVKAGLVEKSGAWFSYDSIRIGQGRENSKQYLKENPEICDRLEAAIRGQTEGLAGEMMAGPDADQDD